MHYPFTNGAKSLGNAMATIPWQRIKYKQNYLTLICDIIDK